MSLLVKQQPTVWEGVRMAIDPDDGSPTKTEEQHEWADWSAHGYRKLYQPRSMRRLGLALTGLLILGLLAIFWLAASGRFP
jgi:hypothetical protein